ncbi:uncharacterized protein BO87DRAFT_393549 [Aspergillus neoniger CBS 115656]|uniref:Uncharacterized protein n=1 Tax=Aspergillus neoniger (strain CBS 115656) TaxID=1448310 RepID=A0A318YTM7_ASPNB|nr:hypothetical protein BO87DRAFT_393549 [Aspergillus neoniger CBS 115656]PYH38081.1 hypothetical protein BO87DRAFT_393549 [Aspergillus neoniger CBS 115656]
MRVHPSFLGTLALSASTLASAELNVRTVYQFASNDTWLENLAVRSNGLILATEIGPPASLLSFDPRSSSPKKNVIHTFSSVLGLSGITEAAHDVFYVTGANTTSDNISDPPKNATHIWRVDFTTNPDTPDIKLIARPTAPTGFNGLAAFNETIILASASYHKTPSSPINGLKVQDNFVYWTANGALYRAELYSNVTAGPGELIVQSTAFDDFAVAPDGLRAASGRKFAYAATAAMNTIMQISFDLQGGRNLTSVIAGSLDSTEVAEPTGCAFGRGEGEMDWLYVTTGGASAVNVDVDGVEVAVGAQLLGIKLN